MRKYQALLIVQCDLVKIYITNMNKGICMVKIIICCTTVLSLLYARYFDL